MILHTWLKINSLAIVATMVSALALTAVPVYAVSDSLSLNPSIPSANVGSTYSVDIHEDSGTDAINAVQANVIYPITQVHVVSVTVASGWSVAQNDTSTPGKILYAAFPTPAGSTATGDNVIGTIVFRSTGLGLAPMTFDCIYNASTCPTGNAILRASDNANILTTQTGATASMTTMTAGNYITSQNVLYKLVMQGDGNLVLYWNNLQPLWASNTSGSGANRAVLQNDGNFVLYTAGNNAVWNTGTQGIWGMLNLFVQDDGNVVAYTPSWTPKWSSQTGGHASPTFFGSDRLRSGITPTDQTLLPGRFIRSADGRYALRLQGDGNLVLYSPGYHVLWSTGTSGRGVASAVIQSDGNFVLKTSGGTPIWWSGSWGHGDSYAVIQGDGNFVIYTNGGTPIWASNTSGQF